MQLWPIWDAWAAARGGASASDSADSSVLPLLGINLCLITVISHRYFITNANNLPIIWLEEERGFLQCMALSGSVKNLTSLFPSLYSLRRWGLSSFLYNYAATPVPYPTVLHVVLRLRKFILQRLAHCFYLSPVTEVHMTTGITLVLQGCTAKAKPSGHQLMAQWSQGACVWGAPSLTGQPTAEATPDIQLPASPGQHSVPSRRDKASRAFLGETNCKRTEWEQLLQWAWWAAGMGTVTFPAVNNGMIESPCSVESVSDSITKHRNFYYYSLNLRACFYFIFLPVVFLHAFKVPFMWTALSLSVR